MDTAHPAAVLTVQSLRIPWARPAFWRQGHRPCSGALRGLEHVSEEQVLRNRGRLGVLGAERPSSFHCTFVSCHYSSKHWNKVSQCNGKANAKPKPHDLQGKPMENRPWPHYESNLRENGTAWDRQGLKNLDLVCIFSEKVT